MDEQGSIDTRGAEADLVAGRALTVRTAAGDNLFVRKAEILASIADGTYQGAYGR